jgi:ABC-type dipeptide/oligopeptide/nickel transport system ATPase component
MAVLDERVHALAEEERIRAAFAIALAKQPRLLVLDLPYQADAGNPYPVYSSLVQRLGRDGSLAIVVCTNSLAVAADVADDVLVTYDGCPVEYGSVYDICLRPSAPYVQDLLRVTPSPHRMMAEFMTFVDLPHREGCPWVHSCRSAVVRECSQVPPPLQRVTPGHVAACHLIEAVA